MLDLVNDWRAIAKKIREEAAEITVTPEARAWMLVKAETIDLCANDLLQEYMSGGAK